MAPEVETPHVSGVFIYPLKGAAGVAVRSAELDELGFVHDRRWMIVDANGEFVSQRTVPRLALVRAALLDDRVLLRAPGAAPLPLPLVAPAAADSSVHIWDDDVLAASAGDNAAAWISAYLGFPARIVGLAPGAVRPVNPGYARRPTDRVAFVDAFPCLLISQAALDALNLRLALPVPMNRFRPNLVVERTIAHAEDGWKRIRTGTVVFNVVKPCSRCVVTTVDQSAGVAGDEPLRTLSGYRRVGGKVMFGQNLIHRAPGRVSVGDPVEVLEARA